MRRPGPQPRDRLVGIRSPSRADQSGPFEAGDRSLFYPEDLSRRIDILRLILIIGIVFIHVPFDDHTSPYMANPPPFETMMIWLRDGLFRVGVPCLSLISGYLIGLKRPRSHEALLAKKGRTLVVPFLIFNLSVFFFVLGLQFLGGGTFWPDLTGSDLHDLLDALFSIYDQPINIPLYFLRDLIVCIILYPALAWIVQRAPRGFLLLVVAMMVLDLDTGIILRTRILLAFSLGMALAMHRVDIQRYDRFAVPALTALVCISAGLAFLHVVGGEYLQGIAQGTEKLATLTASVLVWFAAAPLAAAKLGHRLAKHARYSFFIFCTHQPILVICAMVQSRLSLPYPLFFFASAGVALLLGILLFILLERRAPGLLAIMTGARVRQRAEIPLPSPSST